MTASSNQQKSSSKGDLKIVRCSGSLHSNPLNGPENIVSSNPTTYFSSQGIGSYFDLEIREKEEFNTLVLGFYRGKERKTKFTVTKTDDFCEFEPVEPHLFVSSGETDNPQKFHFKTVSGKGVRVSFDGNLDNGHIDNVGVIDPLFLKQQQQLGNVNLVQTIAKSIPPNNNNATNGTITNIQQGVQNFTATQISNAAKNASGNLGKDWGPNSQYFSITSAALLNEQLPESENEKLDNILKEIEEIEKKQEGDEKCIRCGSDCDKGICPHCGITGNYNRITYNYISENFPISYDVENNSFIKADTHVVDTSPSASVPAPLGSGKNKAPLLDKPGNSGNVPKELRKQDEVEKAEQQKINDSSSTSVNSKDKDNAISKVEEDTVFKKPNLTTTEEVNKNATEGTDKAKKGEIGNTNTDKDGNSKDKIVTTTQTTTEAKKDQDEFTLLNKKNNLNNNKK